MKKIIIVVFFSAFFIPFSFSQNVDNINSGHLTKSVAFNFHTGGNVNFENKEVIELLLFGDNNALVEFFHKPFFDGNPCTPAGFRIVRDSLDQSYIIEIKHITNFEAMRHIIVNTYESIGIPGSLLSSIPEHILEAILTHHRQKNPSFFVDYCNQFTINTLYFQISDQFAEKLYKNMYSFIENFKITGTPPPYISGGYLVKFRTVVDDLVWTLRIYEPRGNALKMADLCRQILTDVLSGKLNKQKYVSVLKTFED